MTIDEFCDLHGACNKGREWAIAHCVSMQDAWERLPIQWLLWVATRPGVLTDRELRLFAVWSARQVQHLMTDERSLNALDVAERYANGDATDEQLAAAGAAALAAAWDAAREAARAAARDAAWAAVWAAASDSGLDAAWAAAGAAARAAARAAASDAAVEAAGEAQCTWLRENTRPCFERGAAGRR